MNHTLLLFALRPNRLRQHLQHVHHIGITEKFGKLVRIQTVRFSHLHRGLLLCAGPVLRLRTMPFIEGLLDQLRIRLPVFVQNMGVLIRYHLRLRMTGVTLHRLDVTAAQLQLVGDAGMADTVEDGGGRSYSSIRFFMALRMMDDSVGIPMGVATTRLKFI